MSEILLCHELSCTLAERHELMGAQESEKAFGKPAATRQLEEDRALRQHLVSGIAGKIQARIPRAQMLDKTHLHAVPLDRNARGKDCHLRHERSDLGAKRLDGELCRAQRNPAFPAQKERLEQGYFCMEHMAKAGTRLGDRKPDAVLEGCCPFALEPDHGLACRPVQDALCQGKCIGIEIEAALLEALLSGALLAACPEEELCAFILGQKIALCLLQACPLRSCRCMPSCVS